MLKSTTLLLILFVLSACSSIQPKDEHVIIHPEMPRSLVFNAIEWKVIEDGQQVYIATPYQSYLDNLQNSENVLRYIQQLINTVCYYRTEMAEEVCKTDTSN